MKGHPLAPNARDIPGSTRNPYEPKQKTNEPINGCIRSHFGLPTASEAPRSALQALDFPCFPEPMAMVSEHRTDMKPMAKKRPKTMVVDSSSDGWSSDGSFAPHPTRPNVYVHRFRRPRNLEIQDEDEDLEIHDEDSKDKDSENHDEDWSSDSENHDEDSKDKGTATAREPFKPGKSKATASKSKSKATAGKDKGTGTAKGKDQDKGTGNAKDEDKGMAPDVITMWRRKGKVRHKGKVVDVVLRERLEQQIALTLQQLVQQQHVQIALLKQQLVQRPQLPRWPIGARRSK